jgi:hypothetical protein
MRFLITLHKYVVEFHASVPLRLNVILRQYNEGGLEGCDFTAPRSWKVSIILVPSYTRFYWKNSDGGNKYYWLSFHNVGNANWVLYCFVEWTSVYVGCWVHSCRFVRQLSSRNLSMFTCFRNALMRNKVNKLPVWFHVFYFRAHAKFRRSFFKYRSQGTRSITRKG